MELPSYLNNILKKNNFYQNKKLKINSTLLYYFLFLPNQMENLILEIKYMLLVFNRNKLEYTLFLNT